MADSWNRPADVVANFDIELDQDTTELDGVSLVDGMRVLVRQQDDPAENWTSLASVDTKLRCLLMS